MGPRFVPHGTEACRFKPTAFSADIRWCSCSAGIREANLRTLYIVDRVALGERWLSCRRGLVFIGSPDGAVWHAVIYDPVNGAFDGFEPAAPLAFTALTLDGIRLEGIVELGNPDKATRTHYLPGLGTLRVRGETARRVGDAVSWVEADAARDVG